MLETLQSLSAEVLTERDLQSRQMKKQWEKALPDRIAAGRALGHLRIAALDPSKNLIHFIPPREDFAIFQAEQSLRLSLDDPEGDYFGTTFVGLTGQGLTLSCPQLARLPSDVRSGWTLDEDLIDLSSFYLRAIEALGQESHGRDKVFPVLFGEQENTLDGQVFDETMDRLEDEDFLNESQADAVAVALASSPFHLIQGPPGTGKTHALARLVEELVRRGERVLITGFTHRAIHNALRKIHDRLGDQCPVVKISKPVPYDPLPVPVHPDLAESGLDLHPGPYVIGATPFALYSKRLEAAHFDSAVFDETSQLTVPATLMAMMKSDQWFFFGDHKQLPPVSLAHADDPARASVFSRLVRQCQPTTLRTTYRLNEPLTLWPSQNFYSGHLVPAFPRHRLALKSPARLHPDLLSPDPSLVRVEVPAPGSRSRNENEAEFVAGIILDLLTSGLPPGEIGVVTPFRAQASLIRQLLRGDRFTSRFAQVWREITVDTVERFQGQEREVILFSFTASHTAFLPKVAPFLFQAARLNVAVTRARTKVILLHSPEISAHAGEMKRHSEEARLFLSLLTAATPLPSS